MNEKTSATPHRVAFPHDQIANRAYILWCARGCPADRDVDIWLEAERQLRSEAQQRRQPTFRDAEALGETVDKEVIEPEKAVPPSATSVRITPP